MKSFIDWAEENDLNINEFSFNPFKSAGSFIGGFQKGQEIYNTPEGKQQLQKQRAAFQNLQQGLNQHKKNLNLATQHLSSLENELKRAAGNIHR